MAYKLALYRLPRARDSLRCVGWSPCISGMIFRGIESGEDSPTESFNRSAMDEEGIRTLSSSSVREGIDMARLIFTRVRWRARRSFLYHTANTDTAPLCTSPPRPRNGTWRQDSFAARERYCLFTAAAGNGVPRRPEGREPFPVLLLLLLEHLLHLRLPALSGRDHLFTGRCDLVIPPLSLGNVPPSTRTGGEEEEENEDEDERIWKGGGRDEVVKSLGRLKIIQGSSLRADALPALKETSNLLPAAIARGTDRSPAVFTNTDATRADARVLWRVTRDDAVGQWNDGERKNILSRKLYAINDTDKPAYTSSRDIFFSCFDSYRSIFIVDVRRKRACGETTMYFSRINLFHD